MIKYIDLNILILDSLIFQNIYYHEIYLFLKLYIMFNVKS